MYSGSGPVRIQGWVESRTQGTTRALWEALAGPGARQPGTLNSTSWRPKRALRTFSLGGVAPPTHTHTHTQPCRLNPTMHPPQGICHRVGRRGFGALKLELHGKTVAWVFRGLGKGPQGLLTPGHAPLVQ